MMLVYLGETDVAERIHNAWLSTIEKGIHTYDIFKEGVSHEKVGTKEFAYAVVKSLGQKPKTLPAVSYQGSKKFESIHPLSIASNVKRELVGVDVFVYSQDTAAALIKQVSSNPWSPLSLQMITNRGVSIWPSGHPETFCVDQYRLRFTLKAKDLHVTYEDVLKTIQQVHNCGYDVICTENLYNFDGAAAYSSAQG